MKRKLIAMLLACTMVLSAGCSANVAMDNDGKVTVDGVPIEELAKELGVDMDDQAETEETNEDPAKGGIPWVDYDLKDNIKEDMELSPKDDYYLYVNHDWLLNANIKEGKAKEDSFYQVQEQTDKKALALLNDDTLSGHDADLVQSYYKAILDWDARNKAGLEPIMDTVKDIQSIDSLDELSDFICDPDRSRFVPTLTNCGNTPSFDDSMKYITVVATDGFILGDAAEYSNRTDLGDNAYKATLQLSKAMLTRMDYTESEIEDMLDDVMTFEGKRAEKSFTSADSMSPDYIDKINNVYEPSDLKGLVKSYPLVEFLDNNKYGDADRYLVMQPEAIKRIDELYTEDNLETIKNYMLITYVTSMASVLDADAYDAYVEAENIMNGSTGREDDEKVAFDIVRSALTTPMDRLYLEKYDSSEKKDQITKICQDVIAVYREMLDEEDWLSDETRKKAVEKLDSMTINSVYPDKWVDYSNLDLKGKSLFDCNIAIMEFSHEEDLTHTNGTVDREIWGFDILEANAYYDPQNNSINLILGILDEPFYYEDISEEALLGGIGSVIGHEISHAFDTNGAQYDKDGNYTSWWTDEDYKAFKERADKLIEYYDGITVWKNQKAIGKNIQTEAIADMAGMKAMLKIAEGKEDFDYDKFFSAYATVWRRIITREGEYFRLTQDSHPLHFLRANVTVQQFDEFYKTYDVQEGDNMYLAPEDRILVW